MVIGLERGAGLHMTQLMPLPLTVSCFNKIQIGFTFLVPAHPGSPGQRAVKRVCVRACVRACVCVCACEQRGTNTSLFSTAEPFVVVEVSRDLVVLPVHELRLRSVAAAHFFRCFLLLVGDHLLVPFLVARRSLVVRLYRQLKAGLCRIPRFRLNTSAAVGRSQLPALTACNSLPDFIRDRARAARTVLGA